MTYSSSLGLARINRGILTILVFITTALCVCAQSNLEKSTVVYFRLGSSVYEPEYRENGARLEAFLCDVAKDSLSGLWETASVDFSAGASAEGPSKVNTALAKARLATMTEYLRGRLTPTSSSTFTASWQSLADSISYDASFPRRDETLSIISSSSTSARSKETALKFIGGGMELFRA